MYFILSYENEDISILDNHVDKKIIESKLKTLILEFFKSQKIELEYEELFKESDSFYLVKNENGSISLYRKTTDVGWIYNAIETKEVRVYYIKSNSENKPQINLSSLFDQQKSKLKKAVIIPKEKKDFNVISELLKDEKFLRLRASINPDDFSIDTSKIWK